MVYRMPKNMIINENVVVNHKAFHMLFNIVNLGEFYEGRDMVFFSPEFKKWLKISDNQTVKKYLSQLVSLGRVESYNFDVRGNLTINKINIGNEFVEIDDDDLTQLSGRALQVLFYIKYYRDLQSKFPEKYFYDYVTYLNISKAIGCGNDSLSKVMKEIRNYPNLAEFLNTESFNRSENSRERISLTRKFNKNKSPKILTESDLENYLIKNLDKIEPYLHFVDNQYYVEYGVIDILAIDAEGTDCVIEVKISDSDKRLPYQCAYYPKVIGEGTRMIVVAPDYREDILIAMNHLDVELFIYKEVDDDYEIIKYEV